MYVCEGGVVVCVVGGGGWGGMGGKGFDLEGTGCNVWSRAIMCELDMGM